MPPLTIEYGKPPAKHRFKTSQSGNPSGRRIGYARPDDIVLKLLNRKISVNDNGMNRQMSHFEALAHRLVGAALKGNQVAIDQIHKCKKSISPILRKESRKADVRPKLFDA